jgi:hypothetical protein
MSQDPRVKMGIYVVGAKGSVEELPKPLQKVAKAVAESPRPVRQMTKDEYFRSRQGGGK